MSASDAIKEILALWKRIPPEHRSDFTLCFAIIASKMGIEWLKKHFDPDSTKPGIFKLSEGVGEEEATRNFRAIDLAECLLNLKDIEGLDDCLAQMKEAENPEAGLAELHVAKMLYVNQWPFRFVKPQGNRGNDYDLEIICHNQLRCGDAKCKIESTAISSDTITSTLKNARTQLPPDGAGVFFIKFPQQWMFSPDWERIAGRGAANFFAMGTQRLASVVFYVEPLTYRDGVIGQGHFYLEVMNPRHKLARAFDWHLFERWKPPPVAPNTMPSFYYRLANFPRWIPGYEEE